MPPELQRIPSTKLEFICANIPGHLNPKTALGRQLQARRNHEIIFPYSSGAGDLPFISGFEKDHVNKDTREMSKIQGLEITPSATMALPRNWFLLVD